MGSKKLVGDPPKSTDKRIMVAIVGNIASKEGLALVKAGERLDRQKFGRCVVYDADVNVLTLLDWAIDEGVSLILLIFPPFSGRVLREGVWHVADYKPIEQNALDTRDLVKDIWMNLTGSLMPGDYVRAMRALSRLPFSVYECVPRDGGCVSVLREWLGEVCDDKDNRDR